LAEKTIKPCPKLYLGGAFNPVHHGHLLCARAVAEALGYGTVVLIPSRLSPQKTAAPSLAAPEDRLAMCQLAVDGTSGFEVEAIELHRPAPSYTIDTVREFIRQGIAKVPWLIGADQALMLHTWREPQELMRLAHIVVMARPGWRLDWEKVPEEYRFLANRVVSVPAMDISSTDIRRRVAGGLPINFLTPGAVCRYIEEHGLYRS
jgi:nicotinate-nucleotide adenylyltransferase